MRELTLTNLWVPSPAELDAIRQIIEDDEATIATLRAEVALLKARLAELEQIAQRANQ